MLTPVIILVLLTLPLATGGLLRKFTSVDLDKRTLGTWGLGVCFLFFSMGHFVQTDAMVAMLPPQIPLRTAIVYLTGGLEVIIACLLFRRSTRRTGALLAIAVLVLFFPANIYAAWHGIGMGGHQWGLVYLWIRAPLQGVLIAWAYGFCLREAKSVQDSQLSEDIK